jgi:hypothetical protein
MSKVSLVETNEQPFNKTNGTVKNNTSPFFNKKVDPDSMEITSFKGSTVIKNATTNLFFSCADGVTKSNKSQSKEGFKDFKEFNFSSFKNPKDEFNKNSEFSIHSGRDVMKSIDNLGNYPSLITPQVNQANSTSDEFANRQMINLEELYLQEEKLWNVLNAVRFERDGIKAACNEWFIFANMNSMQSLDNYFLNSKLRAQINLNYMCEAISVTLVYICFLNNKFNEELITALKKLLFCIHQNGLIISNLILERISKDYLTNIWYTRLNGLINSKVVKSIETDKIYLLEQHNKLNLSSLSRLINLSFNVKVTKMSDFQFFAIFNQILENIEYYSYQTVKHHMYMLVSINLTKAKNRRKYPQQ